ncbi:hypothetical protein [Bacteroides stercoris]|jgi:hypothetical protein|uniref:hypothetical protein n=1 Tax=Bacteroides stercoris TaxID=46506 RepID=UPI0015AF81FE|nr:MAG TPA: hypothetical protein [Caudoviricetes sp.]
MSWIKDNKTEIQLITAMLLILFGCTLIMMGFWVYPLGVIHNSILIAFGEMLTFAGAVFGIDYHYKMILNKKEKNKKEE